MCILLARVEGELTSRRIDAEYDLQPVYRDNRYSLPLATKHFRVERGETDRSFTICAQNPDVTYNTGVLPVPTFLERGI